MYNVDMLLDVRNAITMNPGQHNQGSWSSDSGSNPLENCGTTCCIAGWTLAVNGMSVQQFRDKHQPLSKYDVPTISEFAGGLLGLSDAEAYHLFLETMDEAHALRVLDSYIEKGKNQNG